MNAAEKLIKALGGAYIVTRPEYYREFNKWPQEDRTKRRAVFYSASGEDDGERYLARWEQDRSKAKVMTRAQAEEIAQQFSGKILKANAGEMMEIAADYIRANSPSAAGIADKMKEEASQARRRLAAAMAEIEREVEMIRAM